MNWIEKNEFGNGWFTLNFDSQVRSAALKIFQRYHFSSALKRMAVIAGYSTGGSLDTHYIAAVKGAPEALKSMFSTVPANYDEVYLALSRKGSRVLAVGYRNLGVLSHQVITIPL